MNKPVHNKFSLFESPLFSALGLLVLSLILIFASGCASRQSDDPDFQSQSRRAAESNTSLGLEYMNRGQYEVALGKLKKSAQRGSRLRSCAHGHGGIVRTYWRAEFSRGTLSHGI